MEKGPAGLVIGASSALVATFSLFAWIVAEVGKDQDKLREAVKKDLTDQIVETRSALTMRIDRLERRGDDRVNRVVSLVLDQGTRLTKIETIVMRQKADHSGGPDAGERK